MHIEGLPQKVLKLNFNNPSICITYAPFSYKSNIDDDARGHQWVAMVKDTLNDDHQRSLFCDRINSILSLGVLEQTMFALC